MIKEKIKNLIKRAIEQAQKEKKLPPFDIPEIVVTRPTDKRFAHYDFTTNIPAVIAPIIQERDYDKISGLIAERMPKSKLVEEVKPASVFINFKVSSEYLISALAEILEKRENYGASNLGQGKKVQVEFISANPTGPLTLGNGRGGFAGDVLSGVLEKAGYKVTREYFVNDKGRQIEILGYSILAALGYVGQEKEVYKGKYINDLARELEGQIDLTEETPFRIGQAAASLILKKLIKKTIKKMQVKFDAYFQESSLYEEGGWDIKVLEYFKRKDLIYEKDGALWFKAKELGDTQDWVLYKSDGQPTYFLSDIAYHLEKFQGRKFDKVINFWGADHSSHVRRLKTAMSVFGFREELEIVISQFVRLVENGKEVKMSKREGKYVALDELLDEIPLDVVRFFFLMPSVDRHMDFNLTLAKERSQKNPVYYVQYAYARLSGILRRAGSGFKVQNSKLALLNHPAEMALIKELVKFPELVEEIASNYQVHHLPYYAISLADKFHNFYEKCRVLDAKQGKQLKEARVMLLEATKIVLKNTFNLLGISAPQKM